MYANKVNGSSFAGEHLTSLLDYITIATKSSILQNGDTSNGSTGDATSQARLDKLIEVIALKGQPVIMSKPTYDGSAVFTLKVAIEHTGAWVDTDLSAAIVANQTSGMGFTTANTGLTVTIASTL